ncbi:uncharacterized protein LOC129978343 isoform X2 [Argiope bruennichi]|nr:uncharacterized protein LOC129978343 isoform X2 [Argiope bruennichi]
MHENILKVEKENLETIRKELNNQKETNVKTVHQSNDFKKIPKHASGPSSTALKTRSALFKGVRQQPSMSKVQTASNTDNSNINSDNVCKNAQPNCQYSSIHFLNHFHSSFLSSKTQRNFQSYDVKDKYIACAVPLAPPCQKKEIVNLKQDIVPHTSSLYVPNNVAYHFVSDNIPKKLSIQVLPSISIMNRKPCNNENVRIEEIRERNYASGDCVKTTVLPAVSEEVRNRIASINLSSVQGNKISPSKNKNDQPSIPHLKKSVFTQSSQNDGSLQVLPDKDLLKETIREVLQEFQHEFLQEFIKLSADKKFMADQNEQNLSSPENDCELDSFIGNADSLAKDVTTMVFPNIFMKSNCTQTNCDQHETAFNEIDVKNLIHEVVLEMQQNSSLKFSQSMEVPTNAFTIEKVHRDIQVDLKHDEINQVISHTSKAVQASFITENETLSTIKTDKGPDVNDSFTEDHFESTSNAATVKNSDIPECHGTNTDAAANSEIPTKLESVLNFIYNRFCRETGELSLSTERILSNPPPIRTREVSIQFNPVSTSTKSTTTSEVALVDASNQCDVLLPKQVEEKEVMNASVQAMPESEMIVPVPVQEKVDSSVQWEQPVSVLRDSYVQTMDFLMPSENSAHTSVSSTPVSDSIFLDDMLSEGEVFLPWNLRLLSHADKTAIQSLSNAYEASDKEKDYSLSEGEVPPKYLQQLNLAQSPSYDSSSGAYSDPPRYSQNTTSSTQRGHSLTSPEVESLPLTAHERRSQCRASSSSLSEGEVKNSSSSLSEGEVPYGFLRQRLAFQHASSAPSSAFGIPQHESGIMHGIVLDSQNLGESSQLQENFGHSILDLSEGEVIGRSQTPYQSTPFTSFLDTVSEEK